MKLDDNNLPEELPRSDKELKLNQELDRLPLTVEADEEPARYGKIKKSLATLDKFLSKKFVLLLGFYFLTVAICATGLLVNNGTVNAASGGSGAETPSNNINIWLYSIIATFTFIMFLLVVYILTRKHGHTANRTSEPKQKNKS